MTVQHVEFLVEERSMEAALRHLLPGVLLHVSFGIRVHLCKNDLLQRLPERLRGYRAWIPAEWRIVVVLDRDEDDCNALKNRLDDIAQRAGFVVKSETVGSQFQVVNRLAIEELEAWYFGDWEAVRAAYPRVAKTVPKRAGYRDPDAIRGGTWEAFERLMKSSGYFEAGLRKIEAANAIAPRMDPSRNTSRSFRALFEVLSGFAVSV